LYTRVYEGKLDVIQTNLSSHRHARKRTDPPFIRQLFVNGFCSEDESGERLVCNESDANWLTLSHMRTLAREFAVYLTTQRGIEHAKPQAP